MDDSKPVAVRDDKPSRLLFLRWALWDWLEDHTSYGVRRRFDDCEWLHPVRFVRRVLHVLSWFPILWHDVDWDYSSLYAVMEEKIRRMRACVETSGRYSDLAETAAPMRAAEKCLRRLREDDFCRALWDEHYLKFPRTLEFEDIGDGSGNKRMVPMSDEASESFTNIARKEEEAWQAEMADFCRILSENVRNWWD